MERAASLSISAVNAYETRLVFGDVPLRRLRLARPSSPALPILSPAAG
jgi:hypothetical protein